MRAIVIDDSRAMRGILKRVLTRLGYAVVEACDGNDGLKRLIEVGVPDLILVDWNMPELNGIGFLEVVRQERRFDAVPIVMVTTEVEMHQVERALKAGATDYLMKPFTDDGLEQKIISVQPRQSTTGVAA